MRIGDRLKRCRKVQGLTLEDVAKQVGLSRQTLSRYETGVIGKIPSDKIEILAKVLHTTPAYLMGWEDSPIDDFGQPIIEDDPNSRHIFAKNLRMQMVLHDKTRMQICNELNIKYTTFASWYNGDKYPRIDKIELLAQYFGISKSELIEEQNNGLSLTAGAAEGKKNPALMTEREIFAEIIALLADLPPEKLQGALDYLRFLSKSEGR